MTPRIRSDHNEDDTASILRKWTEANRDVYHHVDMVIDESAKSKKVKYVSSFIMDLVL